MCLSEEKRLTRIRLLVMDDVSMSVSQVYLVNVGLPLPDGRHIVTEYNYVEERSQGDEAVCYAHTCKQRLDDGHEAEVCACMDGLCCRHQSVDGCLGSFSSHSSLYHTLPLRSMAAEAHHRRARVPFAGHRLRRPRAQGEKAVVEGAAQAICSTN